MAVEDSYMDKWSKEISYLTSILNSLKPVTPVGYSDWEGVVEAQHKVYNTLMGDFAIKMTDLEQRLKQNTLRIYGIPEKPNKDLRKLVIDFLRKDLKLGVNLYDIEDCCRSGVRGKSRPIVVKFASREVKKCVLKRSDALEREDICEELCQERIKIRKEALRVFGKKNVSIADGCVIVTMTDGNQRESFPTMVQFKRFLAKNTAHSIF